MAVYYYRGVPIVAPLTIESNEPFFASDTLSLKQERVFQGSQRWELSFEVAFRDEEANFLTDLFLAANLPETMVMPQLLAVDKRIDAVAEIAVATFADVNSGSVMVDSATPGVLIPKGSFITFESHPKVYLTLTNHVTSGTASALSIYPKLTEPVYVDDTVRHPASAVKPEITFYQTNDTIRGLIYEDGVMVSPGLIKLIEAL